MDKIYDNGRYLLGQVKSILKCIEEAKERYGLEDDVKEMYKDLRKNYNYNDIVCIYYDKPMGYDVEIFKEKDVMFEEVI